MALLLVVVILLLGNHSFKATDKAAFGKLHRRQLVLAGGAAGGIELYFETVAGVHGSTGKDTVLVLVWQSLGRQGS